MVETTQAKARTYEESLRKAHKFFARVIVPMFKAEFGVELSPVEAQDNEVLQQFDIKAGKDWIITDEKGIRGLAVRQQFGGNWRDFSIRTTRATGAKTELEKRVENIEYGREYPQLTYQGFASEALDGEEHLLSAAIITTDDLFDCMENHPECVHYRTTGMNQIGQAKFAYIYWDDLRRLGYRIWIKEG